MRIIGGTARGREILLPQGNTTRPILSLLKGRLFNILGGHLNGETVWDLFAGSGTLGLEAASRGARRVLFVEKDRQAFARLEENIGRLDFSRIAVARFGDCRDVCLDGDAPSLVFLDPPFPLVRDDPEFLHGLLEKIVAPRAEVGVRVVFRTFSGFRFHREPAHFRLKDRRDHGENSLLFLTRRNPSE